MQNPLQRRDADACTSREGSLDKPKRKTPENSTGRLQSGEVNRKGLAEGVAVPEEWRDLVRRIQEENDTNKLASLVEELICKFDEEKLRKASRRPPAVS